MSESEPAAPDRGPASQRSGIDWSRAFYTRTVLPVLVHVRPGLRYVAGRFGTGSDVLGLDDALSRDHDWGLRLTLLVAADHVAAVEAALEERLPERFEGLPVRYAFSGQQPRHHVEVRTAEEFLHGHLGFDPRLPMSAIDWLSMTGQSVLEVTAGAEFHDPEGLLTDLRRRLSHYPDDVRRLVLAADWIRIGEELPVMGRAGHAGDEAGSAVIAARLVQAAMHLAFTIEGRWAPYSKWLGTTFRRLEVADRVGPLLAAVLTASGWQERQAALADALDALRERQDGRSTPATRPFWDRPFLTVDPGIAEELHDGIGDRALLSPDLLLGSAEQRTDLVPILTDPARRRALVAPIGA